MNKDSPSCHRAARRGLASQTGDCRNIRHAVRREGRRRTARFFEPQYSHASAHPAAEAISDKGRPRRRSVKNRRPFDCFKSAEGIRFSAGAAPDPEIVSPRHILAPPFGGQKVEISYKVFAVRRTARAAASARGGPQLTLRSHAVSAGCAPKNFPLRRLRLFEPRSSPPPNCGGLHPLYARFILRRRRTAPPPWRYASCRRTVGRHKRSLGTE